MNLRRQQTRSWNMPFWSVRRNSDLWRYQDSGLSWRTGAWSSGPQGLIKIWVQVVQVWKSKFCQGRRVSSCLEVRQLYLAFWNSDGRYGSMCRAWRREVAPDEGWHQTSTFPHGPDHPNHPCGQMGIAPVLKSELGTQGPSVSVDAAWLGTQRGQFVSWVSAWPCTRWASPATSCRCGRRLWPPRWSLDPSLQRGYEPRTWHNPRHN